MPDDPQIPVDPNTQAMLDLVKQVQTATQTLQANMRASFKDVTDKCKMVAPLGGTFRESQEIGYVLQYIRNDPDFRKKVVDFVKGEADKLEAAKKTATSPDAGGTKPA